MLRNTRPRRRPLYSSSVPKEIEKPKIRWRVLPILWHAIKRTCTVIGAFVLISAIITLWSAASLIKDVEPVAMPSEMVLYLELQGDLADLPREGGLANPFAASPSIRDFTGALENAAKDPRVLGVIARLRSGGYALAHIEEMRESIKHFRDSGKFAYFYASGLEEGLGTYYLASAFQEIWLQPIGVVAITGVNAEMPFLRDTLSKIGIEPQFFQRKQYKSAYESLTNSAMSQPNREMMQALINDITNVISTDIAADRNIPKRNIKSLVDHGLFTADEALAANLVTRVDYADQLVAKVNKDLTGDPESEDVYYVDFNDYIADLNKQKSYNLENFEKQLLYDTKPDIALIYASGMIMPEGPNSSASAAPALMGDSIAAADEIAGALIDAAYDDSIKAVVLRIDSPGGSPEASETILRATQKVQEKGKPVIVSMGPTAASGGYWIAASADRIFALPTTLTGSIGVLGGKVSAAELWTKIGVNWDSIKWGENAAMWSINKPFSASEAERMNAMLDNVYTNFIARVARGRKLTPAAVDKIAGGRVWSGASALKIGLVDELGGLGKALDYAAAQVGAADRNAADIILLPEPLTPFERLLQMFEVQASAGKLLGAQSVIYNTLKPVLKEAAILNDPNSFTLYTPVEIR